MGLQATDIFDDGTDMAFGAGPIEDLTVAQVLGTSFVFAIAPGAGSTVNGDGIATMSVSGVGRMEHELQSLKGNSPAVTIEGDYYRDSLHVADKGATAYVVGYGNYFENGEYVRGFQSLRINADGSLSQADSMQFFGFDIGRQIMDSIETDSRDFVTAFDDDTGILRVIKIGANGNMTITDSVDLSNDEYPSRVIGTASRGESGYVIYGKDDGYLEVIRFNKDGLVKDRYDVDPNLTDMIGSLGPLTEVSVGDRTFLIGSGGLWATVLELTESGSVEVRDMHIPTLGDDHWNLPSMNFEAFKLKGESYVAISGNTQAVMHINENGYLHEVDESRYDSSDGGRTTDLEVYKENGKAFVLAKEIVGYQNTNGIQVHEFTKGAAETSGNSGNNFLQGNASENWLSGKVGEDRLIGGGGDDLLEGGKGADTLEGGVGHDNLDGGNGRDELLGGEGWDNLDGGKGNDKLIGGSGFDVLHGGAGNDVLFGGKDLDMLYGGNGRDTLVAGEGNDILYDGRGQDQLTGNAGADVFVLKRDGVTDIIKDWQEDIDRIDLRDFGDIDFFDLTITNDGAAAVRVTVLGETLKIIAEDGSLAPTDLGVSDFVFL